MGGPDGEDTSVVGPRLRQQGPSWQTAGRVLWASAVRAGAGNECTSLSEG